MRKVAAGGLARGEKSRHLDIDFVLKHYNALAMERYLPKHWHPPMRREPKRVHSSVSKVSAVIGQHLEVFAVLWGLIALIIQYDVCDRSMRCACGREAYRTRRVRSHPKSRHDLKPRPN